MTEQTYHNLAESISALMDNEASELELQRILKASQSDAGVKATWARYQLASAVMRRDMPAVEVSDFSARVSAALDAEPVPVEENTPVFAEAPRRHWWQNMARVAVAASVAGGVIFFAQNPMDAGQPGALMAAAPAAEPAPAVSLPSGYHGQALSLRTVGMQQGYEARQQDPRQVMFVPRQSLNSASAARPASESPEEVRDYLIQLIEAHADNAALNSSQGMLPFARVIFIEEE